MSPDAPSSNGARRPSANGVPSRLDVRLPSDAAVAQDEEWCEVRRDGGWQRIRFHDYHEIYSIPGLYELLFSDLLECASPRVVAGLLGEQLRFEGTDPAALRTIDLGAGNGMVAEELVPMGMGPLLGIDLIEEAREAANRDRPGLYDDYLVADMTALPASTESELRARGFNALVTVAALGFGDIPPAAFVTAYNLISAPGWVAFNIKHDFLNGDDSTGFARLLHRMLEENVMEERSQRVYRHRLSVNGKPLSYVAMVARKRRDVPRALAEEFAPGAMAAG